MLPAFPEVNLRRALSRARAASISRLWGTALVAREINSIRTAEATPSTARSKAGSLTFEGFVNPETFLTNCSAAPWISASVAGGSKLYRVLMFRHTCKDNDGAADCAMGLADKRRAKALALFKPPRPAPLPVRTPWRGTPRTPTRAWDSRGGTDPV